MPLSITAHASSLQVMSKTRAAASALTVARDRHMVDRA
jgi:hypothetical protein